MKNFKCVHWDLKLNRHKESLKQGQIIVLHDTFYNIGFKFGTI